MFRDSLDARMKFLISEYVGVAVKQAEAFTEQEEEKLWQERILGYPDARTLLNTLVFLNGNVLLSEVEKNIVH